MYSDLAYQEYRRCESQINKQSLHIELLLHKFSSNKYGASVMFIPTLKCSSDLFGFDKAYHTYF